MGIGKNRSTIVACAFAILSCCQQPSDARERNTGIWRTLRAGQFSGAMNEEAQVQPVKGFIIANDKRYQFWEYSWTQTRQPGHGRDLLLVFEGGEGALIFLGSYAFDSHPFHGRVHPQVRGKVVFFSYKDIEILGVKIPKEISFENGPPATSNVGEVYSEFSR